MTKAASHLLWNDQFALLRTWLLEHTDGRRACRLSSALGWFWYFQGRVGEGRQQHAGIWMCTRQMSSPMQCDNGLAGPG